MAPIRAPVESKVRNREPSLASNSRTCGDTSSKAFGLISRRLQKRPARYLPSGEKANAFEPKDRYSPSSKTHFARCLPLGSSTSIISVRPWPLQPLAARTLLSAENATDRQFWHCSSRTSLPVSISQRD